VDDVGTMDAPLILNIGAPIVGILCLKRFDLEYSVVAFVDRSELLWIVQSCCMPFSAGFETRSSFNLSPTGEVQVR